MINNKKIEEAKDNIFNKHFLKNNEGMICIDHISEPIYLDYQIKQAIELGAHWAINEFLKNLWHPASEEPKFGKGRLLVLINGGVSILNVGFVLDQLRNLHNVYGIEGWLYLNDLLPKEGGEQ
jgi:hypothetical protein